VHYQSSAERQLRVFGARRFERRTGGDLHAPSSGHAIDHDFAVDHHIRVCGRQRAAPRLRITPGAHTGAVAVATTAARRHPARTCARSHAGAARHRSRAAGGGRAAGAIWRCCRAARAGRAARVIAGPRTRVGCAVTAAEQAPNHDWGVQHRTQSHHSPPGYGSRRCQRSAHQSTHAVASSLAAVAHGHAARSGPTTSGAMARSPERCAEDSALHPRLHASASRAW
jgi:hypothetical protein